MSATTHETLLVRYRIRARLRATGACRIAAVASPDAPVDGAVVRDGAGRPYLPGTTLKGALRGAAESMLRVFGSAVACDPIDGPTCSAAARGSATRDAIDRATCRVCALFGSTHLAGRLTVLDAPADGEVRTETRGSVAVDRDYETARGSAFALEVVSPGSAFAFEAILENPTDADIALVVELLERLADGDVVLGAAAGRGFGRFVCERPSLARIDATALLDGRDYAAVDWPDEDNRRAVLDAALSGAGPSEE